MTTNADKPELCRYCHGKKEGHNVLLGHHFEPVAPQESVTTNVNTTIASLAPRPDGPEEFSKSQRKRIEAQSEQVNEGPCVHCNYPKDAHLNDGSMLCPTYSAYRAFDTEGVLSEKRKMEKLKEELLEAEDNYAAVENWVGYETIKAVRLKIIELEKS